MFGPAWVTWMMPFERYYGVVMRNMHSKVDYVTGTMQVARRLEYAGFAQLENVKARYTLPTRYRSATAVTPLGKAIYTEVDPNSRQGNDCGYHRRARYSASNVSSTGSVTDIHNGI